MSELLWTFSRLPKDQRITLKQNPHFYYSRDLPDRPPAYDDNFVLKPVKELVTEKDLKMSILLDRNGQIFFDHEKFSKTYGNLWKPHNTVILKGNHRLPHIITLAYLVTRSSGNAGSCEPNKTQSQRRSVHLAKGM